MGCGITIKKKRDQKKETKKKKEKTPPPITAYELEESPLFWVTYCHSGYTAHIGS
jgi:hypothetical protein